MRFYFTNKDVEHKVFSKISSGLVVDLVINNKHLIINDLYKLYNNLSYGILTNFEYENNPIQINIKESDIELFNYFNEDYFK